MNKARCKSSPLTPSLIEDRSLSEQERHFIQWLLEHGEPDATAFLPQLADAADVDAPVSTSPSQGNDY